MNSLSAVQGKIVRSIPDAYWSFLLPFGLLGIIAAQLVFGLGDHRELPGFGVFAILVGIGAIALWAATVGRSVVSVNREGGGRHTLDPPSMFGAWDWRPKVVVLIVGSIILGVLLFRVVSGADNTWDIGLWFASIGLCAALFVPARRWAASRSLASDFWERIRGHVQHGWHDILPLLAVLAVYCALTVPNLTAWRFAALGDEYLFYEHARSALEIGRATPFGQNGVYDNNPEFNTLYKAGWMALFGDGHFGWKMTGVASIVLALSGMYVLGSVLVGRSTAIAAAGFLAASHYLFGLLNGGYNHLDALPVTIWAMVAFVLGVRTKEPWLFFLAGAAVGLGFYFHYSARIVGPVMLLTAVVVVSPRQYLRLWPVALGFLIVAWPTLLVAKEEILTKMLAQTAAGYSEHIVGPLEERLMSNIKLNLSAFHFNAASHTYVGGPLLDPITGTMAAIGIGYTIGNLRSLVAKLCLIWVAVAFLATGLTSPYPTTAITRLFPMVPPLALLAGLVIPAGFKLAASQMPRVPTVTLRIAAPVALVLVLGAILWLNQHRALVGTHEEFHYTTAALAVGAFRTEQCGADSKRTVFVGAHRDSALSKAVASYDSAGSPPKVIPFAEFDAAHPLPEPACVIIPETDSQEARRVMWEFQERYPDSTLYTFTSPSMKSSVQFFHIPRM